MTCIVKLHALDHYLEVLCSRWTARISAVRAGARTYAKLLHSLPWQGSAWGDCASAALAEHTLRKADDSGTRTECRRLRAHAARLLRGKMQSAGAESMHDGSAHSSS